MGQGAIPHESRPADPRLVLGAETSAVTDLRRGEASPAAALIRLSRSRRTIPVDADWRRSRVTTRARSVATHRTGPSSPPPIRVYGSLVEASGRVACSLGLAAPKSVAAVGAAAEAGGDEAEADLHRHERRTQTAQQVDGPPSPPPAAAPPLPRAGPSLGVAKGPRRTVAAGCADQALDETAFLVTPGW
jgi:hypothetical protein